MARADRNGNDPVSQNCEPWGLRYHCGVTHVTFSVSPI
jgi:hypothetical protein